MPFLRNNKIQLMAKIDLLNTFDDSKNFEEEA
jgi:hypothetical protein